MIVENRRLVFSNSALRQAFGWYQIVANQKELPHGVIAGVTPRVDGGVMVSLQQSGASKLREVVIPPSRTLAVLLLFCRKQRVPIPRDADKHLAAADDNLVLTIDQSIKTTGPTG